MDGEIGGSGKLLNEFLLPSVPDLGKNLIKKLVERKIQCTYGSLNCLATELPHTHLVLLSATAVWSNGSLLVPRGSSAVAHLSGSFNIPILVTVKSYQFIDKVSCIIVLICVLFQVYTLEFLTSVPNARLYEILTADMVSGLVTDIGILPPSSVPAVLKTKNNGGEE